MPKPHQLEFGLQERAHVVARMEAVYAQRNGWINFSPILDQEEATAEGSRLPNVFSLFNLLFDRGPETPVCTWVPGKHRSSGTEPISVGVQHPSGQRAVERLRRCEAPIPEGWRVIQDHPRRGVVLAVPQWVDHDAVLQWLLRAGNALSLRGPADTWRASVYIR